MKRALVLGLMAVVALGAAGCGKRPMQRVDRGYNCIGFADDIKTLQVGDELPRVVQVLGMPFRAYRAYSPFGRNYDVLEYKVGESACAKTVLRSKKDMLPVVFDAQGRYIGSGEEAYTRFRRATTTRVEALAIDPVVLKP